MTIRVINLPAAMHVETARCLFAIELSKQSWVIGFITPFSAKISRRILSGGDWKGLLKLIEEVQTRVSRETGRAVEVMSCYEAGYDGFWLHRLLEAHGIRNYGIDPASLQVDRRARRVKTDRIDTERLLRSLMAYLRGEPKVWSVVRVPSIAEEDARRLHRERDRLVSERVQHVNRIKGLCALHGIYDYQPLRPQAMARLEKLRTAQGISLPPRLKSEIKRELQRLELVVEMIATLEQSVMRLLRMQPLRISTPRKSENSISSRRSAPSLPRCWLARYFIVTSTIAANRQVILATRRARFRAETWRRTKGSGARALATRMRDLGTGCTRPDISLCRESAARTQRARLGSDVPNYRLEACH